MTRPLNHRDGAALLSAIAARRSLADLEIYAAALATGPTPDWARHPKIVAAIEAKRAELLAAAETVMVG